MTKEELIGNLTEEARSVILEDLQNNPNERRLNDLNQGIIPMIGFYTVCEFINQLTDQIVDRCIKYSVKKNIIYLNFSFGGVNICFTQTSTSSFYNLEINENIKNSKEMSALVINFQIIFEEFFGSSNLFCNFAIQT